MEDEQKTRVGGTFRRQFEYTPLDQLGAGSVGDVFRGTERKTRRRRGGGGGEPGHEVAIKRIDLAQLRALGLPERDVEREVTLLRRMAKQCRPDIQCLVDAYRDGQVLHIVTDLVGPPWLPLQQLVANLARADAERQARLAGARDHLVQLERCLDGTPSPSDSEADEERDEPRDSRDITMPHDDEKEDKHGMFAYRTATLQEPAPMLRALEAAPDYESTESTESVGDLGDKDEDEDEEKRACTAADVRRAREHVAALQDEADEADRHEALWMAQLFDHLWRALAHVHALGVAHRDIKPENVLVHPETGAVVLIDFGQGCDARDCSLQDFRSTDAFMAPELRACLRARNCPAQTREALLASQRADVYSLGLTLFWALTHGRHDPALVESDKERWHALLPAAFRAEEPEHSFWLVQMLAANPESRPLPDGTRPSSPRELAHRPAGTTAAVRSRNTSTRARSRAVSRVAFV